MRTLTRLVAVTALLFSSLDPGRAHAQFAPQFGDGFAAIVIGVAVGGLVIGVAGLASAVDTASSDDPSPSLLSTDYVLGTANLAIGVLSVAKAYDAPIGKIGVAFLVIGVADVGIAVWASCRGQAATKRRVALVPQVTEDAAGRLALGAGLRISRW